MATASQSVRVARRRAARPGAAVAATNIGGNSALVARKRKLIVERLQIARDGIAEISTEDKDSWRLIISELSGAGIADATLEGELAASKNTLYKWKNGLSAPREMTRRLLKKAVLEILEEHIQQSSS